LNLIRSLPDLMTEPVGLQANLALAESNHRISNSLSLVGGLLHLQAAELARAPGPHSSRAVALLLDQAVDRIQTVGRLHRLLSQTGPEPDLELSAFLRQIVEATAASLAPTGRTEVRFLAWADCIVPVPQALPIGLIVGELLTNSLKYAHPTGVSGLVEVSCRLNPAGGLVVQVRDDGVGLPEGFDPRTAGNLGLRLVRALALQVGGDLRFLATGVGLLATLTVPEAR
ncbi:MAG: sensor histidine kinase, partial [Phenylobacterium sp.]